MASRRHWARTTPYALWAEYRPASPRTPLHGSVLPGFRRRNTYKALNGTLPASSVTESRLNIQHCAYVKDAVRTTADRLGRNETTLGLWYAPRALKNSIATGVGLTDAQLLRLRDRRNAARPLGEP